MRIREVQAQMTRTGRVLPNRHNKGIKRQWRALKRADALSRDSKTKHTRTKAHRLGKCAGDTSWCRENMRRDNRRSRK